MEVDITKSIDKLAILASLGIPEVWRYANESLSIYALGSDAYSLTTNSRMLPEFPIAKVPKR